MRMRNLLVAGLLVVPLACSSNASSPPTAPPASTPATGTAPASTPRTTITIPSGGASGPSGGGPGSTTSVGGDPSSDPTTSSSTTVVGVRGDWHVDTSTCPDPAATTDPITGTLTIAMAAPLTGGIVAAQWKPVIDGFRTAIDRANLAHLVGDLHLDLRIVDDRLDPDRTVDALQPAIDAGAQVVAGIVGTDTNLAARFTLNEQCVPQLVGFSPSPGLGDVVEYPWTMGFEPPVPAEVAVLGSWVGDSLPAGGTLGVYAASSALGDDYVAAATELAGGERPARRGHRAGGRGERAAGDGVDRPPSSPPAPTSSSPHPTAWTAHGSCAGWRRSAARRPTGAPWCCCRPAARCPPSCSSPGPTPMA